MKKKKILLFFFALCLVISLLPSIPARALADPVLESRAAIIVDRTTGNIFFSKNASERVYPASTTKIMTVLLAVEAVELGNVALDDQVTASLNMGYDLQADGSSAGIVEGETMSLESLMFCAMLSSANEACNIIAEYVSGSIPAFIERMNQRAAELGCADTHFANTHGLPDAEHYTTASDFCRIALEASSHDLFMRICSTSSIDIPATNLSETRHLVNSNALISDGGIYGSGYLYPDASGIKTGHTNDAGYCLVSTASRNGISLLAAVFGGVAGTAADGTATYSNFADSITLYNWVFDNFSYHEVLNPTENIASVDVNLGADADYINLRPASAVTLLLPNDYDPDEFDLDMQVYSLQQGESVTAPITAGEVLGEVTVLRGDQQCGTVKLVASNSVSLSRTKYIMSHIRETTQTSTFRLIVGGVIVILALYLVWVIIYRIRVLKYRRAVKAANRMRTPAPKASGPSIEFISGDGGGADGQPALEGHADADSSRTGRKKGEKAAKAENQPPQSAEPAAPEEPFAEAPDDPAEHSVDDQLPDDPLSLFQSKEEEAFFDEFFGKK